MTSFLSFLSNKVERYIEVLFKIDNFRRVRMIKGKAILYLPFFKKLDKHLSKRSVSNLSKEALNPTDKIYPCFLTAIPHPTTGIGHAFSEWNTGRIIARICGLQFVHISLPSGWNKFLALEGNNISLKEVLKIPSIRIVRLPEFNYRTTDPCLEIKNIISSYKPKYPTLFVLADGQNLYQHHLFLNELKLCYFSSHSPSKILLEMKYGNKRMLTVAVHIRRGDIELMRQKHHSNWKERYLELTFFSDLLEVVRNSLPAYDMTFNIYSQGNEKDFSSLLCFKDTNLFVNYDQYETMNDKVFSDILVLSPSGFSFMAGLISNSFKIARYPWWHDIPDDKDWCRVSNKPSQDSQNIANKLSSFFSNQLV